MASSAPPAQGIRRWYHCAALSFANVGIERTLAIYCSSVAFGSEVRMKKTLRNDADFRTATLMVCSGEADRPCQDGSRDHDRSCRQAQRHQALACIGSIP